MSLKPAAPFALRLSAVQDDAPPSSDAQDVLQLFDECAPRLHRYVRSCGLPPDAAEDVVQDAFVALFRHLALGGARHNLRGWLVQVSYRSALKHRERLARRERRERPWTPHVADTAVDPADGPEALLSEERRRRRLRSVMRALPERERQCLYLRAEGLTYRDIAAALGVSLGTVAKSLTRAVSRLISATEP